MLLPFAKLAFSRTTDRQTYIFPDPLAQQVEQLSTDNRKLELHLGA
jgi:hypothetical protein